MLKAKQQDMVKAVHDLKLLHLLLRPAIVDQEPRAAESS
jgi:hypothetical protein